MKELARALDRAGLWSDLCWVRRRRPIRAVANFDSVVWPAGGAWPADGEDLSEGNVEVWLGGMAKPLRECGVELGLVTAYGPWDEGSTGYSLVIGGTPLHLYTFVEGEPGLPDVDNPWTDCATRPAGAVNALLEAAGSSRRIALFWPGGNDGYSMLGEEHVFRRVMAVTDLLDPRDFLIP